MRTRPNVANNACVWGSTCAQLAAQFPVFASYNRKCVCMRIYRVRMDVRVHAFVGDWACEGSVYNAFKCFNVCTTRCVCLQVCKHVYVWIYVHEWADVWCVARCVRCPLHMWMSECANGRMRSLSHYCNIRYTRSLLTCSPLRFDYKPSRRVGAFRSIQSVFI